MDECRAIQHWIEFGRSEPPATVTRDELARHLKFIAATLPAKTVDSDAGRDRVAVYFRMLSGHTNAAIAYMAERVCREHDWFPTPSQCLSILGGYRAPPPEKETARANVQAFLQAAMDGFMDRLRNGVVTQELIDSQPAQWKRVAENLGLLREVDRGYVQRLKKLPPQRDLIEVEPDAFGSSEAA